MKTIISFCFLFLALSASAQVKYFRDTTVRVIENNNVLPNAWAGGFNSPVFAQMDVNNDGLNDLLSYESQTERLDIFINRGEPSASYRYAPEYRKLFPLAAMASWIRTYDYDNDGDLDLFSYMSTPGIRIFRNMTVETGSLSFTLAVNCLNTHYSTFVSNIYVSPVNMPALTDLDNDGDMDVLGFSNGGNYVECHKNLALDSSASSDFLMYNIPLCWGYFALANFSNTALLPPLTGSCPLWPANPYRYADVPELTPAHDRQRHNGSSVLALDMDGDGDKDILNGDILGNNLLYMENCGTPDSAWMCSQDTAFPSYNVPSEMHDVGAPYYFDVDNDGNNDLLVANFFTGEDLNNVLFYKNTTNNNTNVFSFVKDRLLSDEMIEKGTGAHPVLTDIDGDGLTDLIIGNDLYYNGNQPVAKLSYYKNTGTASVPEFTLITDDFAGVSAYNLIAVYPTFGDLDNDGDKDMILGNSTGTLLYFMNIGGANFILSQANYQSIDVGDVSTPQLVDVNYDGKLDLLIGRRTGLISYYQNNGSVSAPVFAFITSNFGGINVMKVNAIAGFSVPMFYNYNGSSEMIVGSESGYLYHYTNIDGNLAGTFTLADSMYQDIFEPVRAAVARADIDNDGKADLVIGNASGGCVLYTQNSLLAVESPQVIPDVSLYPNPASDFITLHSDQVLPVNTKIIISDMQGREVGNYKFRSDLTVSVTDLASGVYLLKVLSGTNTGSSKLFIKY